MEIPSAAPTLISPFQHLIMSLENGNTIKKLNIKTIINPVKTNSSFFYPFFHYPSLQFMRGALLQISINFIKELHIWLRGRSHPYFIICRQFYWCTLQLFLITIQISSIVVHIINQQQLNPSNKQPYIETFNNLSLFELFSSVLLRIAYISQNITVYYPKCCFNINNMSKQKQSISEELKTVKQQNINLKQQYDQLLQKNQNDVIKIRQREKNLTDQIEQLKTEHQNSIVPLKNKIAQLEAELTTKHQEQSQTNGKLTVSAHFPENNRISQLQADIRRLIDQNIILTAENTSIKAQLSAYSTKNQNFEIQIQKMTKYIQSLEADLKQKPQKQLGNNASTMTTQHLISAQQHQGLIDKGDKQAKIADSLRQLHKQLNQKLKNTNQQLKRVSQRQKKTMSLLKKRDIERSALEQEINKLKLNSRGRKTTEVAQSDCKRCDQYKQEIQLLKQMVKSTQGMVRVKQIQNQKYRLHSGEQSQLKQSKSAAKHIEKNTSLPPLKKK